ncbi:hypothetical protein BDE36_1769 [Arcticibacter tournemirensis]|uniref:Uncharacterized protein n=1 Tax=Arcticibacter tournemirensis TaxID=699437 RepID=A0A5M9HBU0_9SPHI|nr:hypothetical protein [Arcticibacter tournemirensis]KAA8483765.1 hypothetical protein F1649_07710 [Arcticibacter tournemirensis]TQM50034.1 hypothetical protein BDE36_1769 [Arcticibacter tournemirensis]
MNTVIAIKPSGKPYKFYAPSTWNEVNEKQLVTWAAITLKRLSFGDAARLAMIVFYRMPVKLFFSVPEAQKVQLAPTLRFLFGHNTLTQWVIPRIRRRFRWYYGPEHRLQNITIGEYSRTELYYQAYVKRNDEKALDMLIATLYRPLRKGTAERDIREELSDISIRKRAKRMSTLSKRYRHAILLNYEGCRNFIRVNFLDKLPSEGGTKPDEIFDYNKVILAVAGANGKFGTKSETERAFLYDFLQHLVTNAEEIAKLKTN